MPLPIMTGATPKNTTLAEGIGAEIADAVCTAIEALPVPVVNIDMKPLTNEIKSIVDEIRKLPIPMNEEKYPVVDWFFEIKRGKDKLITEVIARAVPKAI